MKALSIRQPWAWGIVYAGKDVENRTWCPPTGLIGQRFLIHAAKGCTRAEYDEAEDFIHCISWCRVPALVDLERGGIVGAAVLDSVILQDGTCHGRMYPSKRAARRPHPKAESRWWAKGQYGLVLRDVVPLRFKALRGSTGFFVVPRFISQQIQKELCRP